MIETKLDLTVCSDKECIVIATHQLEDPSKSWWDNYTPTHSNPVFITWMEFCEAFREQYLPNELLIQKAQEDRGVRAPLHEDDAVRPRRH
jgi:hypothetical protein